MNEFEVTVYTKVKETYVIKAETEDEARKSWSSGEMVFQECIEVEEVADVMEVDK